MLDMRARGSPVRTLLALVSVLVLMLLAQIGPSNATPPDEVAVRAEVVPVSVASSVFLTAIDMASLSIGADDLSASSHLPAPERATALTAPFTASPTRISWRSSVSRPAEGLNPTDARPPNRQRT